MARPVILGNGALTVGLDEHGLVHDFYYPYVGLDNLTNARSSQHKIGVWVDGQFSWVDGDSWEAVLDFDNDALVSRVTLKNDKLQLELNLRDFVDSEFNAFGRQITVKNQADSQREIRLFMHQVFQISRAGRADTALYVPDDNYLLDYKGRCSLLIYGQINNETSFDQYAVGSYGIEGKEGTFRDAEDGELSGSAVEHGGVDSVMRFSQKVDEHGQYKVDYWIVAADSQQPAEKIHHKIKKVGLGERLEQTRAHWNEWLATGQDAYNHVDQKYLDELKKSMMVIKAHCDKRGGIIASCDSSIYNYGRDYYSYVWPRDGAFALWPLIRMGYQHEARVFFEFCRDILHEDGYLMHKYQPDRAIGSTWHPLIHGRRTELAIQEDETAVVIFMLGEYYNYTKDLEYVRNLYGTLIRPAANFMEDYIDHATGLPHASYDLWEEKFLTNTYSVAVTYRALLVAAEFATHFDYPDDAARWHKRAESILAHAGKLYNDQAGRYVKGYLLQEDDKLQIDHTLDVSSLFGVLTFGLYEDTEPIKQTAKAVEELLLDKTPSGGSPRYEHDHYFESDPTFNGNPWIVTTMWMAQYYLRIDQRERCLKYLDWALQHTLPSGVMPEQINPTTSQNVSVTPLVWSHAEYINTVLDAFAEKP